MEAAVTCAFWHLFQKVTAVPALLGSTYNLMARTALLVSPVVRILIAVLYQSYIFPCLVREQKAFLCAYLLYPSKNLFDACTFSLSGKYYEETYWQIDWGRRNFFLNDVGQLNRMFPHAFTLIFRWTRF